MTHNNTQHTTHISRRKHINQYAIDNGLVLALGQPFGNGTDNFFTCSEQTQGILLDRAIETIDEFKKVRLNR